ncbi:MAG TPA: glycosyltransferase [Rhodocyclaceae bacterium]|nr:glycosyltransferase [Rhodocyclaceae bacterium]
MNETKHPFWSVIVCSINAAKFAQVTSLYERLLADRPFEIIGIDDATSLCEGYNRGIAVARGDILVFSHDDILILDENFADKVEARLGDDFQVLGFAGSAQLTDGYWWASGPQHMRGAIAHAAPGDRKISLFVYGVNEAHTERVQALDGLCLIAQRRVVEKLRFDAETFDGFHLYDLDFTFSAAQTGFNVGAMTDIPIIHMSSGGFDTVWQAYRERFLEKHAAALNRQPNAPAPPPRALKARAVEFRDITALRAAWQPLYLRRATIALRRSIA